MLLFFCYNPNAKSTLTEELMRPLNPCPRPITKLKPLSAPATAATALHTPFDDALTLVKASLPFAAWAFLQLDTSARQAIVRATAGRIAIQPNTLVSVSDAGLSWLEHDQPIMFSEVRTTSMLAFPFLKNMTSAGSAILAPIFSSERKLLGILVGLDDRVRTEPVLCERQQGLLLAASRILGSVTALTAQLESTKHQMAKVFQDSMQDELTGVANRRGLIHALKQEQESLAEPGRAVTVLFVDLDGLKAVNDEYGHDAGDALIQRAAHALASVARNGDTVARVGGDELVVLLPRRHSTRTVLASVERFSDALRAAGVPASVGAASTEEAGDVQSALFLADARMLDEKRGTRGKNVPRERLSLAN
jgi:diguanylate cyclase (GGDEF)-like protein